MNNYLGFGCGAGVALDFHQTRQSYPSLFSSRIINKVRACVVTVVFVIVSIVSKEPANWPKKMSHLHYLNLCRYTRINDTCYTSYKLTN